MEKGKLLRTSKLERETKETKINAFLALDGVGMREISTGIGFFNHILTAFSVHSGVDLSLKCEGDLYVDGHHTVEDTGIVLGKLVNDALGDKNSIERYGHAVIPMDDALASCTVDAGGRAYTVVNAEFKDFRTGEFENCLVKEFFTAFANNAGFTIHISVTGENDHHKIEAMFKAFAHALKLAIQPNERGDALSSKGMIDSSFSANYSQENDDGDVSDEKLVSEIEMYFRRLDEFSERFGNRAGRSHGWDCGEFRRSKNV